MITIKFMCMLIIFTRLLSDETDEPLIFGNKSISRILLGWRGNPGDVPYQVSFKLNLIFEYQHFCGGSIITANKVLSAAHCFAEDPNFCHKFLHLKPPKRVPLSWIYAVAGSVWNAGEPARDSELNGQWRRLKDVNYPTDFDFPYSDICVVVTKHPFIFNEYVSYIPYASQNKDYSGTCLVSGFGSTHRHGGRPSKHLLLAHAPLLPMSKCEDVGASGREFICTAPPSGPAKGDSGGPLVCHRTNDPKENSSRGILVGVTCASFDMSPYYFIYTRVSFYKDIIDDYVNTSCKSKGRIFYLLIYIILLF